jgi:hypothetical protein
MSRSRNAPLLCLPGDYTVAITSPVRKLVIPEKYSISPLVGVVSRALRQVGNSGRAIHILALREECSKLASAIPKGLLVPGRVLNYYVAAS